MPKTQPGENIAQIPPARATPQTFLKRAKIPPRMAIAPITKRNNPIKWSPACRVARIASWALPKTINPKIIPKAPEMIESIPEVVGFQVLFISFSFYVIEKMIHLNY